MNHIFYYCLFCCSIILAACQKEENSLPTTPVNIQPAKGVFIINEGAFNFGNASVSYYDFKNKSIRNKIFQTANNHSLGDVLQSMTIWKNQAYLVLNNSNKIELVDVQNFSSRKTIGPFTSPRYLLPINSQKAYVSDLYADWIYVLDLQTNSKIDSIYFKGWSEEMLLWEEEVFVTNPSFYDQATTDKIYIINTNTNQVIDSITVGFSPLSIQLDKNKKLWVLCEGHQSSGKFGGLFQINPSTRIVEQSFSFTNFESSNAQRLKINPTKDTLYFSRKHIYQMPIDASSLPNEALILAEGRDLYGLAIHPNSGEIFIGESGFFQQKGKVFIYNQEGKLQNSFIAGVGINDFCFY